ncbi:MAG: hypothetical protein NDI91_10815 [Sulfuritalea sp.]|nr:hypothetical protein [Sulfuritalea sp.]
MSDPIKSVEVVAKPFFDQAVWSAVPTGLWVLFLIGFIAYFRTEIREVFSALIARLKDGASLKVIGVEIGASSGVVAAPGNFTDEDSRVGVHKDDDGSRQSERNKLKEICKGIMLVHRLQRSSQVGQLYDIIMYVIPHRGSSLASVSQIEYFFGHYWGDKIYPSSDRSRGFPIVTSAYGPFLCTAKLHFNDGTTATISRYIDFEMGNLAQLHAKSM